MSRHHVFAAATLLAGLASVPTLAARAPQDTETIDRTIPFPDKGTLKLSTFSGHVTITGTSGRDVVIKAVRHATRDRLDHIKLVIDTSGSTVNIDANKRDSGWRDSTDHDNNVVETDFTIQVPSRAMLNVNSFSSPVTVNGVSGSEKLRTFSSPIVVTGLGADLNAETFDGKIDVDASAAGDTPDLSLHTFSGNIVAKLSSSARASVEFDTFSGRLDSDVALTMHSTNRRNVHAELGNGSGHAIKLHTFSGDVKIQK